MAINYYDSQEQLDEAFDNDMELAQEIENLKSNIEESVIEYDELLCRIREVEEHIDQKHQELEDLLSNWHTDGQ